MPTKLPCDTHGLRIQDNENDIEKHETVLYGEKGTNGLVGDSARNKVYMRIIFAMGTGIFGLLIRLVFFGQVK